LRHIQPREPDPAWIEKADDLLDELRTAETVEARNALIDSRAEVWGELKSFLLGLSYSKCWFSEAKDCFSHWDVEHYRPKKTARDQDGTVHDGYWWLSFDWQNLRVCGNAGNRKKGTYFPLRPGSARIGPFGDLRHEDPQLLDPADPDDPALITFNVEGRAIPAAHVADSWERERVEYSVLRYNLDFPPLMDKRKVIWADCWARIQTYLSELALYQADKTNAVAREGVKSAARQIRRMLTAEEELSSVARACILSCADRRLSSLLQST
jgi:hypothetical protein